MKIKGYEIDSIEPGRILCYGNTRYIKVRDEPTLRIEGYMLNPNTGVLIHWGEIIYHDSDLDVA